MAISPSEVARTPTTSHALLWDSDVESYDALPIFVALKDFTFGFKPALANLEGASYTWGAW